MMSDGGSSYHISNEELIEGIKELKNRLGRVPTESNMAELGPYSVQTYRYRYGSWPAAVRSAGFKPVGRVTDEELLNALVDLAEDLGRTPTRREMSDEGEYNGRTYHSRFGSWNEAVRLAGYEPTVERDISDNDLKDALISLKEELGRTPHIKDMREAGRYSGGVYKDRFGSWNNALKVAGIEPDSRVHIPNEELLDELRRLSDQLGRRPTFIDMHTDGVFSPGVYVNTYGTWDGALVEAGFDPYEPLSGEDHPMYGVVGEDHPQWAGGYEPSYGRGWNETKKEAVRERDNRECQNCGRSEEEHIEIYGRKHAIHHIIKARDLDDPDDRNDIENLITLCVSKDCHIKWEMMSPLRPIVSD